MLKENPKGSGQDDLFRARLESIIDMRHELAKLARTVDWSGLEEDFSQYYCEETGRPGGSIRLMAGLLFLKDAKGLSDEEVCAVWRENPYFQYFCGEEFFQHRLPVEPPSLSIFRKRVGRIGEERLLQETIRVGLRTGAVTMKDLQKGQCGYDGAREGRALSNGHAALPQGARRVGQKSRETRRGAAPKLCAQKQGSPVSGKQIPGRAANAPGPQEGQGGAQLSGARDMRDIVRAIVGSPSLEAAFKGDLVKAQKIYTQALNPKEPDKIYSWHAPEVECIAKGKAHKKYEFGCKASLASTNAGNFIVGAMAHHGRPYDGHTLSTVLNQIERLSGTKPREAYVDLGYRGHGVKTEDTEIIVARHRRGITPAKRKRQKRRNAIESVIGHCKNDRKVGPRNWLQGKRGDQINAVAMAIGFNMRKILRWIFLWLFPRLVLSLKIQTAQPCLP